MNLDPVLLEHARPARSWVSHEKTGEFLGGVGRSLPDKSPAVIEATKRYLIPYIKDNYCEAKPPPSNVFNLASNYIMLVISRVLSSQCSEHRPHLLHDFYAITMCHFYLATVPVVTDYLLINLF